MDWTEIEQARAEARKARKGLRAQMRERLQSAGVVRVEARYNGYGDSGNIEDVTLTPEAASLETDLKVKLEDLLWGTAYDLHPGFEINEGGDGEIDWDVTKDAMSIEHREHFTQSNHYSHEGV